MNSGYTRNLLAVAILASLSAPALSAEERGDCDVPITLGSKPTMDDFSGDYAAFLVAALDHKKQKDAQDEQKKTCPEFYRETPIDFDDDENLLDAVQNADDQPEFDYENNETWQGKTTSESFPLDDAESEALSDTQINTPLENLLIAEQQDQTAEGSDGTASSTNSGIAPSSTSSSSSGSSSSSALSDSSSGSSTFSQSGQTGANSFADSNSNTGLESDSSSAPNGSLSSASSVSGSSSTGLGTAGATSGSNSSGSFVNGIASNVNNNNNGSSGATDSTNSSSDSSGSSFDTGTVATGSSSTTFVASSSANAISQGSWQTSIADILGGTNNPNSIYNLYNADSLNPSSDPNDPVQAVLSGEATVDQNGELVFQSGSSTTSPSQQQQQALLLSAFGGQLEDGSQTLSDQLLLSQAQGSFNEQQTSAAYTAGNLDPVSNLVVFNIVTPQGLNNSLTLQLTPDGNIANTTANVEYESCWSSCGEFDMTIGGSP